MWLSPDNELSVHVTPQMSAYLPPSHCALLTGISNRNLSPWASLLLGVWMVSLPCLVGASGHEGGGWVQETSGCPREWIWGQAPYSFSAGQA